MFFKAKIVFSFFVLRSFVPSDVERAGGREGEGARLPYKGLSAVYNDSQAKLATKDDSRLRRYEIGFRPSFPFLLPYGQ